MALREASTPNTMTETHRLPHPQDADMTARPITERGAISADPNNYLFGARQNDHIRAAEEYLDDRTKLVLTSIPFDKGGLALEVGARERSIARWLGKNCGTDGRDDPQHRGWGP